MKTHPYHDFILWLDEVYSISIGGYDDSDYERGYYYTYSDKFIEEQVEAYSDRTVTSDALVKFVDHMECHHEWNFIKYDDSEWGKEYWYATSLPESLDDFVHEYRIKKIDNILNA